MKDKRLLENYLIDVNYIEPENHPIIRNFNRYKHFDKWIGIILGVTLGLYTFKVAVEQLIMQWRIHL